MVTKATVCFINILDNKLKPNIIILDKNNVNCKGQPESEEKQNSLATIF